MSRLSFNQGTPPFVPLTSFQRYPADAMRARSEQFYADLRRRKTIREFSSEPVPLEVILNPAVTNPQGADLGSAKEEEYG